MQTHYLSDTLNDFKIYFQYLWWNIWFILLLLISRNKHVLNIIYFKRILVIENIKYVYVN